MKLHFQVVELFKFSVLMLTQDKFHLLSCARLHACKHAH